MIQPRLEADGEVSVDMGNAVARRWSERLNVQGRHVEVTILSMGNPHAVQVVPDVASAPVTAQGPLIETHPRFPNRVNAGYMQVLDRHAHRAARLGARRGRDALVRHRRLRRGGRRHLARAARFAGEGAKRAAAR